VPLGVAAAIFLLGPIARVFERLVPAPREAAVAGRELIGDRPSPREAPAAQPARPAAPTSYAASVRGSDTSSSAAP
jgi:hypothetical protein